MAVALYPHTPCGCIAKNGLDCPNPARFRIFLDTGWGKTDFLACYGHAQKDWNSPEERVSSVEELPEMYATECRSGDTWVTCEKHRSAYTLFSSKAPKKIHTAVPCENCSVLEDARWEG